MKEEQRQQMKQKFAEAGNRSALNQHDVVGRIEQFYCASKYIGDVKCESQCFECIDYKHKKKNTFIVNDR